MNLNSLHNQKSTLFPLFRKPSPQPVSITLSYFFRFQCRCPLSKVAFHDSTLPTGYGVRSSHRTWFYLLTYCIIIALYLRQ